MDEALNNLPPLSRLRAFEAAARHESFTAAATELGLTQTAVSKQIGQLEDELRTRLFERRNRAVFLTDAGRRFGAAVSAALADIAAEASILRGGHRRGGVVLHCQLCEAIYWLMPRLSRFHERHPEIEVRVVTALAPLTSAGEPFDIAIQTTGRASGSARLLFTAPDRVFPVCAPDYLPEATAPLDSQALAFHTLLSHEVIPQSWMDWPEWFSAIGVSPGRYRRIGFDSFPLVLQAAVAGRGIALGWARTVEGLIADGKLIRACDSVIERPTEISVYRGARRGDHAQVEALIGWLREELA
jgi:DNA-binding transcriptional LysR family regulator